MQGADGSTKGTGAFDLLASYGDGDRPRSRSEESLSATPTRRAQYDPLGSTIRPPYDLPSNPYTVNHRDSAG